MLLLTSSLNRLVATLFETYICCCNFIFYLTIAQFMFCSTQLGRTDISSIDLIIVLRYFVIVCRFIAYNVPNNTTISFWITCYRSYNDMVS